ncbi:hypothetical protein J3458_014306 [Metarhizium acridum]|uniref:uncharacterized protein n=1 Tax=Metarhizium acridum TaxID=92637 RepID=UPI001C6B4279|nr:hypothetical protein J3458_014306 [Metarhizium acridum]
MMVNIKNLLFLSLVAVSATQPILEDRARLKDLVCDRIHWTKDQINLSIRQARKLGNDNLTYPGKFSNRGGKGNFLFNAKGQLWEFPLTKPVWNKNDRPGTFRVIMKENYGFVGVTNKDPGVGNTIHKC